MGREIERGREGGKEGGREACNVLATFFLRLINSITPAFHELGLAREIGITSLFFLRHFIQGGCLQSTKQTRPLSEGPG